jgi:hypothetical protein
MKKLLSILVVNIMICFTSMATVYTSTVSGNGAWSTLTWSPALPAGQSPTFADDAIIIFNSLTATNLTATIIVDKPIDVNRLELRNISTSTSAIKIFNFITDANNPSDILIRTDLNISCRPIISGTGNAGNEVNFEIISTAAVKCTTTVNNDVFLGLPKSLSTFAGIKGKVSFGSLFVGGGSPNSRIFNFKGNLTLEPRSQLLSQSTIFNFTKPSGKQSIINNTTILPFLGDTPTPLLFENIVVGENNISTNLVFEGSNPFAYLENKGVSASLGSGIIINENSILDLPRNYITSIDYSLNVKESTGFPCRLKMLSNAKLRIGGIKTEPGSIGLGVLLGVPCVQGSNFPNLLDNYDASTGLRGAYDLDPTSTVEYYGNATVSPLPSPLVTQTIHSLPSNAMPNTQYGKLIVNNLVPATVTPVGRAQKITKGLVTVRTQFDVDTKTDVSLGGLILRI